MTNRIRVTERDYFHHEIDALFDAIKNGDRVDALATISTLQQMLHIHSLPFGGSQDTCARLYMHDGQFILPDRAEEAKWAV